MRRMGEVAVRAVPDLLITSIWSGGTALMMSTPPESSSAIWVACSGMMRIRTYLKAGFGAPVVVVAHQEVLLLRLHFTSL